MMMILRRLKRETFLTMASIEAIATKFNLIPMHLPLSILLTTKNIRLKLSISRVLANLTALNFH